MTEQSEARRLIARYRVRIPADTLGLLERTNDPIRIRGTPYSRFTWRGVPGRRCDVIVADSLLHRHDAAPDGVVLDISDMRPHHLPPALEDIVLEVGEKTGKYDGVIRRRYALRWFGDAAQRAAIAAADLWVQPGDDELMIVVRPRNGDRPIVDTFGRLRSNLDGYDVERIALWHARRWYTHLDYDAEVKPAARVWAAEARASGAVAGWTLAEANRAAAKMLYHLSRQLGWRKLTAAEKERLYLAANAPQWHRIESLLPRYAALAGVDPTGCGEATIAAANGDGSHWTEPLLAEWDE